MIRPAKCPFCNKVDNKDDSIFNGEVKLIKNVNYTITIIKCSECGAVLSAFPTPTLETKKTDD
jgi:uncharacterized protein YlaI